MNTQEIIENNKIICEYMGFVRHFPNMTLTSDLSQIYYYPYMDRIFDEGLYTSTIKMTSQEGYYTNQCIRESHHLKDMQFHKSFAWLMPVLQKIQNSGCIIEINYSLIVTCRICYLGKNKNDKATNFYGDNNGGEEPIMAIYKCVVEFLKYLENIK
jgi:hypothetical protein